MPCRTSPFLGVASPGLQSLLVVSVLLTAVLPLFVDEPLFSTGQSLFSAVTEESSVNADASAFSTSASAFAAQSSLSCCSHTTEESESIGSKTEIPAMFVEF